MSVSGRYWPDGRGCGRRFGRGGGNMRGVWIIAALIIVVIAAAVAAIFLGGGEQGPFLSISRRSLRGEGDVVTGTHGLPRRSA